MTTNNRQPDPVDLEQPFVSHLIELRNRLLRMVVSVIVLLVPLMLYASELYSWLADPLLVHLPEGAKMIATQVASPFFAPFKLAMMTALFLAMPYILYQMWSFVAPGLYAHEKRFALPLLVASVFLFYAGIAFAYYVVFPIIFKFFTAAAPAGVTVMTDISSYLDFTLTLFLAFGVVFEVPIVTILLVLTGFTSTESLAEKRRYIILGAFIIAAILTPPDVISQVTMALPMWLLFEVGLLFARLMVRLKQQAAAGATALATVPEREEMDAMLDRYEAEQAAVEGRGEDDKNR